MALRARYSSSSSTEPWDLLYISDSSGWKVGQAHAELSAQELGVEVRLINLCGGATRESSL